MDIKPYASTPYPLHELFKKSSIAACATSSFPASTLNRFVLDAYMQFWDLKHRYTDKFLLVLYDPQNNQLLYAPCLNEAELARHITVNDGLQNVCIFDLKAEFTDQISLRALRTLKRDASLTQVIEVLSLTEMECPIDGQPDNPIYFEGGPMTMRHSSRSLH